MVRDGDYWSACRNSRLIPGSDTKLDPHFGQQILEPETFSRALRTLVQTSYSPDRSQLSGESGELGDAR
jgi:hypothetical protein